MQTARKSKVTEKMSEAPQSFKDLCLEDPSLVYKSQALLVQ